MRFQTFNGIYQPSNEVARLTNAIETKSKVYNALLPQPYNQDTNTHKYTQTMHNKRLAINNQVLNARQNVPGSS